MTRAQIDDADAQLAARLAKCSEMEARLDAIVGHGSDVATLRRDVHALRDEMSASRRMLNGLKSPW